MKLIEWNGVPIEDCSKEDLLDCIAQLYAFYERYNSENVARTREENERLQEENKKLWQALGAKA